jgi:hypothetical protein
MVHTAYMIPQLSSMVGVARFKGMSVSVRC